MRAMRYLTLILALGLLLPVLAPAQSPAPANRHSTRDLPLGNSDVAAVEAMLNQNRSPFGTFTILKIKRVVRITDTPEKIEAARSMINAMSSTASKNIRIDILSNKSTNQSTQGLAVSGRVNSGGVRGGFGPNPGGVRGPGFVSPGGAPVGTNGVSFGNGNFRVGVNGVNQKTFSNTNTSQFIVVGNGRAGAIDVSRDVPLVTSFTTVLSWVGITRFANIHWERVGTSMLVKATAVGDQITVEVTPRISQLVTSGSRLGGPSIDLTELTTIVTIPNGGEMTIGGFNNSNNNFNRFFFGGVNSNSATTGSITLKATLQ